VTQHGTSWWVSHPTNDAILAYCDTEAEAIAFREGLHADVPTHRVCLCVHCNEPIAQVRDARSGCLDWYANGGDFGCGQSPDTNDDGCGSHKPEAE
jgi:hypothetical protein